MKPEEARGAGAQSNQPPTRKSYQKPQLQVYGDLSEITRDLAGNMMNDGAAHPNKHFTT